MLTVLPTPPSMKRRSPIVTGGHAPGTAQLAATASTNPTLECRSSTTSSPVAVSIAVTRSTRSGQSCAGSRWAMTSRRTGSATVVSGQRDRADALQLLLLRGVRDRHRGDEERRDVVDVDTGVEFAGRRRRPGGRTNRLARRRCRTVRPRSIRPTCRATRRTPAAPGQRPAPRRRCRTGCPSPRRCPPIPHPQAPVHASSREPSVPNARPTRLKRVGRPRIALVARAPVVSRPDHGTRWCAMLFNGGPLRLRRAG